MDAKSKKSLKRILIRFFPPGIILEFVDSDGVVENKSIDLLNLSEKYSIIKFI
jgi:dynein assembly factor with WDR repeat domains 1